MIRCRLKCVIVLAFLVGACRGNISQTTPASVSTVIIDPSPTSYLTPTVASTPIPTATPFPAFGSAVSVVFVSEQQTVPVLDHPSASANVIYQLEANHTNVLTSGKLQGHGERLWVEIQLPQRGTGWVDAQYLTTSYPADQFCSNPEIQGLTVKILEIFQQKDGNRLAEMVSPIHGLRLRTQWSNPEIFLGGNQDARHLFSDTTLFTFGSDRRSQTPIQGTFMDVIYPMLMDMQDGGKESCNTLDQGLAADWVSGFIQWPFEYANLNYLATFRPAPPEDELNWRMWAFGIEMLGLQPFLTVMVHYQWNY